MSRYAKTQNMVVCMLVLAGLAACSGGGGGGGDVSEDSDIPLQESSLIAGAYANPLDPVLYPDQVQQAVIFKAVDARIDACMTPKGFPEQPYGQTRQPRGIAEAQYEYFVTDPQMAAKYGFASPSWVEDANSPADDPSISGKYFSAAYPDALYGDTGSVAVKDKSGATMATYDPTSCEGKAWDEVDPGWAEQQHIEDVAESILLDIYDKRNEAPSVVKATKAWSACMAQSGYDFADFRQAAEDKRWIDVTLPTQEEIKAAVIAANCHQSSGLLRAQSAASARLTQHELDRHPGIVTRWLELQQAAVDGVSGK